MNRPTAATLLPLLLIAFAIGGWASESKAQTQNPAALDALTDSLAQAGATQVGDGIRNLRMGFEYNELLSGPTAGRPLSQLGPFLAYSFWKVCHRSDPGECRGIEVSGSYLALLREGIIRSNHKDIFGNISEPTLSGDRWQGSLTYWLGNFGPTAIYQYTKFALNDQLDLRTERISSKAWGGALRWARDHRKNGRGSLEVGATRPMSGGRSLPELWARIVLRWSAAELNLILRRDYGFPNGPGSDPKNSTVLLGGVSIAYE
jgi:hypothetical protein